MKEAPTVETKSELTMEKLVLSIIPFLCTRTNFKNPKSSNRTGTCNGVALWIDYNFIDKPFDSNIELNDCIQWDMFVRQGVHLFWKPIRSTAPNQMVHIPCKVQSIDGEIGFNFT